MNPPAWPERPDIAQDFDEFWLVRRLPPQPFPDDYDYGSDRARYGPPGTVWVFPWSSLIDRQTALGTTKATELAIERLLRKLSVDLPPTGSASWTTPLPLAPPADPVGAPMRWIHAVINAKYGDNETISHTLNFRTSPAPDVDQDAAALTTFGGQIRDAWTAFMKTANGTGSAAGAFISGQVQYQEVTVAYLEQTQPATITTHTSRKTGHPVKDFTYPRPTYLVPTQYVPFTPAVGGTAAGTPLPFEVACCVSLGTGLRGPRNRGRLYLGGLTVDAMGGAGQFAASPTASFQAGIARFIHDINTSSGNRLHVVSRAYATSVGVNSVRVGLVPDSQRRRRRSRLESYPAPATT